MSFFSELLNKNDLTRHDGRPLWKYAISEQEYIALIQKIKFENLNSIDPRDVALYYAEWWKRDYNGGKPNKYLIFSSIYENVSSIMDDDSFFKMAKKGASILGVKWVSKENTLYFRTLLLQGGLPLTHISNNQGKYLDFLMAVLEEQPDTIEDLISKTHIINILPESSQNDIIYECCLEIVKSLLNKETTYDDLINSNESFKKIVGELKIRVNDVIRNQRNLKPQNYWLLTTVNSILSIKLRIGLADTYKIESLSSVLGFDAVEREYQFYLDDDLICVFRRMLNGNYKTDWFSEREKKWTIDTNLPFSYVLVNGYKIEVHDFIQKVPDLSEPALWAKYNEVEWRLIKGNGTSNKEAAILFPKGWISNFPAKKFSLDECEFFFSTFEGEIELSNEAVKRIYHSGVISFDWTVVSQKPGWILTSNMPVVQGKPTVLVYDENNIKLSENKFTVSIKQHNYSDQWKNLKDIKDMPLGCIDLKIEKGELTSYDVFFNIGNLHVSFHDKSLKKATLLIKNMDLFQFTLYESPLLEIEKNEVGFKLKVQIDKAIIPRSIIASIGIENQKKLQCSIVAPFEGLLLIDKNGRIIDEDKPMSFNELYGLRILSNESNETILTISNRLKNEIKISKIINNASHPLISYKDEIKRLYFLADIMNYENRVCLEFKEGSHSKIYEFSEFNLFLNIKERFDNKLMLYHHIDDIDLFAVPLNSIESNDLIPLLMNEGKYRIPEHASTKQFIIISSKKEGSQMMPRYVNVDPYYEEGVKELRIDNYHRLLLENDFKNDIWLEVLNYCKICMDYQIPFSTFDHIRAISRSSFVASKAFFLLCSNQSDPKTFILRNIPEMENDLGFCFHWIKKEDWKLAYDEIVEHFNNQYINIINDLLPSYFEYNNIPELTKFIMGTPVENQELITNRDLVDLRGKLGQRVLNELPKNAPKIVGKYKIPIEDHKQIRLVLQSVIAVAESIKDIQKDYPIWGGDDKREIIRRNIQYSQYLNPEFYNKTLLYVLNKI